MNRMVIFLLLQVGDQVQKGQVICIIEAMKLMNEIEVSVLFMFTYSFLYVLHLSLYVNYRVCFFPISVIRGHVSVKI